MALPPGAPVAGAGAAPPPQIVIRATDWITNKQIKIHLLEDRCSSADFRAWTVKFERYLKFNKLNTI